MEENNESDRTNGREYSLFYTWTGYILADNTIDNSDINYKTKKIE